MTYLEFLHFEQLKKEIQAQYLKNHTPSDNDISKWKGIDIIYFQEDLRKIAKGNISEKSFYTYFKTSPVTKLPRIDMLNLLSVYAGYISWYDFKKNHLFVNEIVQETEEITETDEEELEAEIESLPESENPDKTPEIHENKELEVSVLQKNNTDNQNINKKQENIPNEQSLPKKEKKNFVKDYLWQGILAVLAVAVAILGFKDEIFSKQYTYRFIDADRNTMIEDNVEVKILKENGESPILVKLKPNQEFTYTTKTKNLKMIVSSTFYKEKEIIRNLENAPKDETIELQPNNYAQMLYFYSKSLKDLKKKRQYLDRLISNEALIYQVYDSEQYGVETMDKQRYISLVTLPTTSLENLEVINTQTDKNGKINMIKFRILKNEENKQ